MGLVWKPIFSGNAKFPKTPFVRFVTESYLVAIANFVEGLSAIRVPSRLVIH
ncbi:MAG: hypothetical protein J7K59_04590 [Candidatus Korarchaeota archaeon]|nr:hypothetical protein [Candidatus Korarchaeota archaeon]